MAGQTGFINGQYFLNGQIVSHAEYNAYKARKAAKLGVPNQNIVALGPSVDYGTPLGGGSTATPLLFPAASTTQASMSNPLWDVNNPASVPNDGPTDAYGRPAYDSSGKIIPLAMSAGGTKAQHKAKAAFNAARAEASKSPVAKFFESETVKWVLIGGGVLLGGYLLYSMFRPKRNLLQRAGDTVARIGRAAGVNVA